jgi:hypothetical protein
MDRRDITFSFTLPTAGDNDAAYDALAVWIVPGVPIRLVYQLDSGALWYTTAYNGHIQQTETSGGNWGHGGLLNFTITWRIRPDWRPEFSEASDVWGVGDGIWGVSDGLWGAVNRVTVTTDPFTFTLDARGTAGNDLPTIPDTGPLIQLTGPLGGTNGLLIQNSSPGALVMNRQGIMSPRYFIVPQLLSGQTAYYDFARQYFISNGVVVRPFKPDYQPTYTIISPGELNTISLVGQGTGILTGGNIIWDWWRRRA